MAPSASLSSPPRAVIFDLLTALLDSWTLWSASAGSPALGRLWRARYLELTYSSGAYRPYADLVTEAAAGVNLAPSAPASLLAHWDSLEPWPEAASVLARLREKGVLLGVVTNCSAELGRRAAGRVEKGVVVFDALVTAEEAGFYKPDRRPYEAVLARLQVDAKDAVFVAGSPADVPGASAVGMRVVWHNRVKLAARPESAPPMREGITLEEALGDFL